MKRIYLYVAGIVVALVPAVLGLTGNASFSQSVPVRVPDRVSSDDATSTPSRARRAARPTHDAADDRGRGGADDGPNHDVDDDRGGDRDRTAATPDNSGPGSAATTTARARRRRRTTTPAPARRQRLRRGSAAPAPAARGRTAPASGSGDDSGHHSGGDDGGHGGGSTTAGPVGTDPTTDLQSSDADSRRPPSPGSRRATRTPRRDDDVQWRTIATPDREVVGEAPVQVRRVVAQLALGIVVVLVVVTVGGSFAARKLAEREAVNDAANLTDVFAETVVRPALTDRLAAGQAQPPARRSTTWSAPTSSVPPSCTSSSGPRTARSSTPTRPASSAGPSSSTTTRPRRSRTPQTRADISDLDRDENTLDGQAGDKLVEVYRPVWTDSGKKMLFEIYAPYDQVSQRTGQLWRGFAGVTLSSLLLFLVLLAPLFWHLLSRVRRNQRQRELLLQRSVDASSNERRLIAASLHDGPVQDLAATSFVVAGATARAKAAGQHWLVDELQNVAGSVRASIRALRSLLVDIYPASLAQAGLGRRSRRPRPVGPRARASRCGCTTTTRRSSASRPEQERLVYRVAQETLRNAAKHAVPCTASVTLYRVGDEVVLDVLDDGNGFDVDAQLADPEPGHFGLQLLADLAATGGALLQVASVPRRGTHWRLRVPQAASMPPNTTTEPEETPDD